VDTGLDYNHPDISANVWTNSREIAGNGIDDDGDGYVDDLHGWNFVSNTNDPFDDHGHGTHVSGTIAAAGNNGIGVIGVAWHAKIMPVKALDYTGSGYDSALADAIVYAANNGADVISNSWGGYGSSQTIADAVSYAYNMGAVIVAAAGNNGDDARNCTPANLDDVITVAATTPNHTLAVFSNFGPKIDVAAPGVDILSLRASGTSMGSPVDSFYTRASGTSMATPHVSGAVALILAQNPAYSNEQVRQVLRVSAHDLGTSGYDLSFGYGELDTGAAMIISGPLEAKITTIQYGSGPLDPISIVGVARGSGFASYTLEYGAGTAPTAWTLFASSSVMSSSLLGQFDPSSIANGIYTIRLTVYNTSGSAFVDRSTLSVNTLSILSPVPSRYPTSSTTFKPGKLIPIIGTAVAGGFQKFQVQWAPGLIPSGYRTTGITLAGGGLTPMVSSQLATWDTSSITQAGYYTVRVVVTGNTTSTVTTTVYLEPSLLSTKWPVWLDQGPYFNSGIVPALNADGSLRLAVTSPNLGATPGALWIFGIDGSEQKNPLPSYGSFHQPSSADLDGSPGQELVVADNGVVRVSPEAGPSWTFTPTATVDFMKHPLVVTDLDGDSTFDTIAIGNNYASHTAEIFAWGSTGQLLGNFPLQVADNNPLSSWYNHMRLLVGDFDGDGKKEIVVQEGLTSTTYTLRIFGKDGTPRSWSTPILTGIPFAMIAADLDHNGKLETILVSCSGTQATLHVFQPDGSERAGWPLLLPNTNQYSQAFLAVGDLNRDGLEEIVFSHETDMYLFNADGTLFSNAWPLHTGTMGYGAVVLGDIDADGREEIVTTRNDVVYTSPGPYYDQKLLAIRSDGTTARSWQLTGMNGYDLYAYPLPIIGDFNQDGITDIGVAYEVTGPGGLLPGIVTFLTTGKTYDASNDWPMLLHDTGNTGILSRSSSELAPTITTISPANALAGGSTFTLTINGTNFVNGSTVKFNGTARTTTFTSSTQLTASIPDADIANNGSFAVTVTNPDPGGTSNSVTFTVNNPAPTIATISPLNATPGGPGITLTVSGTGFVSGSVVDFDGTARPTTFVSPTQLNALIPAADIATAGTFNITVTNTTPGGGTSNPVSFTVNNPVPTIGTLSPDNATVGGPTFNLTVNGTGFIVGSTVNLNALSRTTTFVSETQLTAAIPAADLATAGDYSVTVTNPSPGGGTSNAVAFPINNPVPNIASLSPASALVGTPAFTLRVEGSGFLLTSTISFNGKQLTTTFISTTQLTADIPENDIATVGTFGVTVVNPSPGGGASNTAGFTVANPPPTLASLSPTTTIAGSAAFILTANGTNFVPTTTVMLDGTALPTTFVSAAQVTANVPASLVSAAKVSDVVVSNPSPGGGTSNAIALNVTDFGLSATNGSSTTVTVAAGQTATYGLQLTASNGFAGLVSMSCSGAPAQATCSVLPTTASVTGESASVTVTVTTAAPYAGGVVDRGHPTPMLKDLNTELSALAILGLLAVMTVPRKRLRLVLTSMLTTIVLALLLGCGSGGGSVTPPSGGTPRGTYSLTLIGSSGGVNRTLPLTLRVN
ncbi:MAG TPA: S8 family serine peptidase, partial [Terriglobales bacterium]|nr:S8 family serine peptidase [Terriglobales bacterium]